MLAKQTDQTTGPRLTIFQLLQWMLWSAVYLAVFRPPSSSFQSQVAVLAQSYALVHSIIMGAVLTAAIVMWSERTTIQWILMAQPGHWLIGIRAVFGLIKISFAVCSLLFGDYSTVSFSSVQCLLPIAYVIAASFVNSWRWKLLFCFLAMIEIADFASLSLGGFYFNTSHLFGPMTVLFQGGLIAGIFLWLSILDLINGDHGGWLHWLGIVCHVSLENSQLLWIAAPFIAK